MFLNAARQRGDFQTREEYTTADLLVFVLGCLYYISHNAS